jgi:hypothetical protein
MTGAALKILRRLWCRGSSPRIGRAARPSRNEAIGAREAALRVDQIDLDPRVDHHQHVEHFLQGRLVHLAVLDQRLGLDDVVGQGPVEALVDLLDVEPGHHQGEAQVDQAEQTDQRQKGGHQLAVEGSEHEPYPARRSLNL